MTSNSKRILTGVIALPTLFSLIVFLPHYNYLAFSILAFVVSILGSYELYNILSTHTSSKLLLPPYLGSIQLIFAYLQSAYFPKYSLILYSLIGLIIIAITLEIKKGEGDNFERSIERISYTVLQIVYPNTLAIFFIKICFIKDCYLYLLIFFLLVFSSDSFAYFFGLLFGENNRGIVKVSPNKSVAGFIAASIFPAFIGYLCALLIPNFALSPLLGLLCGLLTGLTAILGDLVESVLKRSAKIKDSGTLVPGRGGVLDSIDSLVFSIPVYMAFLHFFG